MAICLSHSGQAIYSSDPPANELFVGTTDGVFLLARSSDKRAWKVARQSLKGYHVCSLTVVMLGGAKRP